MRDRKKAGSRAEGGRGSDSGSLSFTASHGIKCQTDQSSTKQTAAVRAMMAFTSTGGHINKIKRGISPTNKLHTHTIKPAIIFVIVILFVVFPPCLLWFSLFVPFQTFYCPVVMGFTDRKGIIIDTPTFMHKGIQNALQDEQNDINKRRHINQWLTKWFCILTESKKQIDIYKMIKMDP